MLVTIEVLCGKWAEEQEIDFSASVPRCKFAGESCASFCSHWKFSTGLRHTFVIATYSTRRTEQVKVRSH